MNKTSFYYLLILTLISTFQPSQTFCQDNPSISKVKDWKGKHISFFYNNYGELAGGIKPVNTGNGIDDYLMSFSGQEFKLNKVYKGICLGDSSRLFSFWLKTVRNKNGAAQFENMIWHLTINNFEENRVVISDYPIQYGLPIKMTYSEDGKVFVWGYEEHNIPAIMIFDFEGNLLSKVGFPKDLKIDDLRYLPLRNTLMLWGKDPNDKCSGNSYLYMLNLHNRFVKEYLIPAKGDYCLPISKNKFLVIGLDDYVPFEINENETIHLGDHMILENSSYFQYRPIYYRGKYWFTTTNGSLLYYDDQREMLMEEVIPPGLGPNSSISVFYGGYDDQIIFSRKGEYFKYQIR